MQALNNLVFKILKETILNTNGDGDDREDYSKYRKMDASRGEYIQMQNMVISKRFGMKSIRARIVLQ
nr:hypothetical protein [uncultured Lachnoanaerobaculum sp.]